MKILIPTDHLCVIKDNKMSGLSLDLLAGNCFDGLTVDKESKTVTFNFESDLRTYPYEEVKVAELVEPDFNKLLDELGEEAFYNGNYDVNVLSVRDLDPKDLDKLKPLGCHKAVHNENGELIGVEETPEVLANELAD